jgi:hypothetical protein
MGRPALTAIAASTGILALAARLLAAGWFFFGGAFIYLSIVVAHVLIHLRTSRHVSHVHIRAFVVSNCFLLAAFLLQVDYGDGPCGWITVAELLPGPVHSPCIPYKEDYAVFFDLAIFVPVWITWLVLRRLDSTLLAHRNRDVGEP